LDKKNDIRPKPAEPYGPKGSWSGRTVGAVWAAQPRWFLMDRTGRFRVGWTDPSKVKVRKTQKGKLIVLAFSFFLLLKSLVRSRESEMKDTKQLYRFLPQTESSRVPLALPRRVH